MLQVDEDLDYLTEVLGGQTLDKGLANLLREELIEGSLECGVDYCRALKVIVREEVKLIQKVADVDTAKRIHLREREDAGKSTEVSR